MARPLDGLVVLDFSSGMVGGLASLVLADYGAEVIKVEPLAGDPFRSHPAWVAWSRGKKSAVIDLEQPAGVEQVKQPARRADVLLESSKPGPPPPRVRGSRRVAAGAPAYPFGAPSTIRPSANRSMLILLTITGLPVGGMPISCP